MDQYSLLVLNENNVQTLCILGGVFCYFGYIFIHGLRLQLNIHETAMQDQPLRVITGLFILAFLFNGKVYIQKSQSLR
jgi:uncharacterized membrane protein